MAALRFCSPDTGAIQALSDSEWKRALDFADRTQLTLPLDAFCRDALPDWVRTRIANDLANNTLRWARVQDTYQEAAAAFHRAGLEFVVLKGFSHCPRFTPDPRQRYQADLDLLFQPKDLPLARDAALGLGYEPITPLDRHPMNHLPTLVRKTGYRWHGIHFDPDLPLPLELHFQLWNEKTERFPAEGTGEFWSRRQETQLEGMRFLTLHPADAVANAALHLLRHVLRGTARLLHVYELAWFLHHSTEDAELWNAWREWHPASLQRLEAVTFALAQRWFDCRLPAAARDAIEQLPPDLERWLDLYAVSPIEGLFRPNKDELWLHWSLLNTTRDRLAMVWRRLFPQKLPGPVDAVFVPKEKFTGAVRLRARWRYLTFTAGRVRHHLAALPPVFTSAIRWFAPAASLGSQYWQLFLSEAFFDFGMFVFFFLYNLYLLKLGFLEDTIGLISSVMTAGSIAGSLLAVLAMQRFGIRATLMASFALISVLSALRASFINKPALLILAAISGIISAVWPVAFAPAIAGLTNEKNRPAGFSFMSAAGISIGVFGGLAASRLPGWLTRLHLASTSVVSYRESLLIGAAIVLLSIWPVSRVRFGAAPPPRDRRLRRPSPMVLRFLVAMVAWYLATGALNPFFNVFFTRRIHLPVENIGYVFSASQIAQIIAILAAPLVFRRFGLTRSISAMQLCTGIAMFALAAVGGPWWAAGAYAGYIMAQYMSEPGMFTLLMQIAPESERSSASALNFLVTFSGQAIAAAAAGRLLQQFGYPPVMIGAAVICAFAALLFLLLMSGPKPHAPSAP